MDTNYLKALDKITSLSNQLETLLNTAPCKTFEDKIAYRSVERVIEYLSDGQWTLEHYSKPVEEGYLHKKSNERFSLNDNELSCGYSLEVWNEKENEWEAGRVEHTSDKNYYFYNSDMNYPSLYDGMRVRIRIKEE